MDLIRLASIKISIDWNEAEEVEGTKFDESSLQGKLAKPCEVPEVSISESKELTEPGYESVRHEGESRSLFGQGAHTSFLSTQLM